MAGPDDDDLDLDVDVQDPFAPPPDQAPSIALVDPPRPSRAPASAAASLPSRPPRTSARPPESRPPPPTDDLASRPESAPPRPQSAGRAEVIASGRAPLHPALRIGIGAALGLGLGWLGSMPYARRAEREIAGVRGQADAIRYRLDPELRARTAALDAEAEGDAARAAWATGGIWLLIAGLGTAAWMRFTRPSG